MTNATNNAGSTFAFMTDVNGSISAWATVVYIGSVNQFSILTNNATSYGVVDAAYVNGGNSAYGEIRKNPGSWTVASVPEPETYALLLAGLGLMGAVARRRKNKQA